MDLSKDFADAPKIEPVETRTTADGRTLFVYSLGEFSRIAGYLGHIGRDYVRETTPVNRKADRMRLAILHAISVYAGSGQEYIVLEQKGPGHDPASIEALGRYMDAA